MSGFDLESIIREGVEKALNKPVYEGRSITEWAAIGMKAGRWYGADKRPPKEGRYIVWGLTQFVPDHCDEPNGFWETKTACWSERWGWDCRVKFWQTLPAPPKEVTGDVHHQEGGADAGPGEMPLV